MGCYISKTEVNKINTGAGESKFKANIVEKEKAKTWWVHTFNLTFKYCEPNNVDERDAREFGTFLSQCGKTFNVKELDIAKTGNTMNVRVVVNTWDGTPQDAERAADQAVTRLMRRDKTLVDGTFKYSSDQFEERTKYTEWAGVDSYG